MNKLAIIFRYISFLGKSGNEHSIHSPFVFELYTKAIKSKKQFYIFSAIEKLRGKLIQSKGQITIQDFGAGSKVNTSSLRSIKNIASNSLKSTELAQLLFRLVEYLKPQVILDLGTSLGITTLYISTPNSKASILSFEGCTATANIARQNFNKLKANNIQLIEGNIDVNLPEKLSDIDKVDFVFFDANHQYEPTMHYFKLCLEKAHEDSCFVFDDIHWSKGMEKAWQEISSDPSVTVSIDLFYVGIVFFRKKQPKEHFILRG